MSELAEIPAYGTDAPANGWHGRRLRIALLAAPLRAGDDISRTLTLAAGLARFGASVQVWVLAPDGDATALLGPLRVEVQVVPYATLPEESDTSKRLRAGAVLGAAFARAARSFDIVHAQDEVSSMAAGPCVRTVRRSDEGGILRAYPHVCPSAEVAAELDASWGVRASVIEDEGIIDGRAAAEQHLELYAQLLLTGARPRPRR